MTEAERQAKQAELDRLLKEEELARLEKEEADSKAPKSFMAKAGDTALSALQKYADVMQYPQKLMSQGLGMVTGNGPTNTPAELRQKMGVMDPFIPPSAEAWKNRFKPSPVGDAILNATADPALLIGAGLGKLATAARAGQMSKWGGRAALVSNGVVSPAEGLSDLFASGAYTRAAGKLNTWAAKEGKEVLPSQIMREGGFVGGVDAQPDFFDAQNQMYGDRMGVAKDAASKRGLGANVGYDVLPSIEKEAKYFDDIPDPTSQKIASSIRDRGRYIDEFYPEGAMPFEQTTKAKSEIAKRADYSGKGAFQSQADSAASQVDKSVATALRNAEERTLQRNAPELAKDFSAAKRGFGATADVADRAAQIAAEVPNQRSLFMPTAVDASLLGGALLSGNHALGGAFLAKKGYDIMKTPGFASGVGYGANKINQAAKYGLLDNAVRRGPWSLMGSSKNSEEEK